MRRSSRRSTARAGRRLRRRLLTGTLGARRIGNGDIVSAVPERSGRHHGAGARKRFKKIKQDLCAVKKSVTLEKRRQWPRVRAKEAGKTACLPDSAKMSNERQNGAQEGCGEGRFGGRSLPKSVRATYRWVSAPAASSRTPTSSTDMNRIAIVKLLITLAAGIAISRLAISAYPARPMPTATREFAVR